MLTLTDLPRRYTTSAKLIDYRRRDDLNDTFYSERPVPLNTETVRSLLAYLTKQMDTGWYLTLPRTVRWSEYSLYFQFAEMSGLLGGVHYLGGPNSVLDLDRSVWYRTENFRGVGFMIRLTSQVFPT